MGDWIGLAVIGFLVLCGLVGLWYLGRPYEVSVEEFEKRAAEAPSLLSAGLTGLQKMLDPATKKAVEAQEDFKQGRYDTKQAKGDGDEAGPEVEEFRVSSFESCALAFGPSKLRMKSLPRSERETRNSKRETHTKE